MTTALKNRRSKEATEQQVLCGWLRAKRIGFFSVPNGAIIGGQNKWAQIQKLKNEGLTPGAPDLVLMDLCPLTDQPVAIEMKRTRGGKISVHQEEVIGRMRTEGWIVLDPKGYGEAIKMLVEIGF